jgi:phosphate-selective porin
MSLIKIEKNEEVNNPNHYTFGSIECLRYLEDNLGDGYQYFLEGNIKKYLHRWRHKHIDDAQQQMNDLLKAEFYLKELIEQLKPR